MLRAEAAEDTLEEDDAEVLGVLLNGEEARVYLARKTARPHVVFDTLG